MAAFVARLEKTIASHDILRVKGFLHCSGASRRQVLHATGGRIDYYFDRAWEEAEEKRGLIGYYRLCRPIGVGCSCQSFIVMASLSCDGLIDRMRGYRHAVSE